jgi:hypothetical protein
MEGSESGVEKTRVTGVIVFREHPAVDDGAKPVTSPRRETHAKKTTL